MALPPTMTMAAWNGGRWLRSACDVRDRPAW
jgi:hypothetical protein